MKKYNKDIFFAEMPYMLSVVLYKYNYYDNLIISNILNNSRYLKLNENTYVLESNILEKLKEKK